MRYKLGVDDRSCSGTEGGGLAAPPQLPEGWTPAMVFDECWARYRNLTRGNAGIHAVRLTEPAGGESGPGGGMPGREFCADFAMIGSRALSRPGWEPRLRLFRTYYVGLRKYDEARRALAASRGTMNWWMSEVRRVAGEAMWRARLWPVREYFE